MLFHDSSQWAALELAGLSRPCHQLWQENAALQRNENFSRLRLQKFPLQSELDASEQRRPNIAEFGKKSQSMKG
jgi:hypothetical protein